jgi:hypothetical protein
MLQCLLVDDDAQRYKIMSFVSCFEEEMYVSTFFASMLNVFWRLEKWWTIEI